ncbi:hypothetical protein FHS52_002385 [Erythromicrobium ramosum]|uniref:Uncharacterized protein n=1 Tax=Erythrobacter ramosus TaxID=35811 RepID=A0A6I4UMF6_9SPHN|nr:hypothetical protein [Erythrobacter ramosus]MBB3776416.1 hypothetical protein [Erythrobacter ramosus]MXP38505.1 hypothetical protein [Erythrobacter ramosus]
MTMFSTIRLRAAAVLTGAALALSGCFMTPGKFTSELAITGPDSFTFSYEGEIFFLGLSKLAQMDAANPEAFTPNCYDDETFESRDCTAEEEAIQREEWEAGAAERVEQAKKQAQQMAALMGGIDPSDPKAAEELVRLLQRQKGWDRVVHKGDGVFDISYRVSGTMGHDFTFPMIEGFPQTNPFVQVFLRKGSQVRINAPGFAAQSTDSGGLGTVLGAGSFAGLAAMGAAEQSREAGQNPAAMPGVPVMDGTFTVRAAAGMRILANNTDEGPVAQTGGEALIWRINPRTAQAPTALIAAAP